MTLSTEGSPSSRSRARLAKRFSVTSFGCKVSRAEASTIGSELRASGLLEAGETAAADVLLVHTCTVTDRADRDDRKLIRRLRRENPLATLVVSGCLAQRDPDALARMSEVDLVLGHGETARLAELLAARDDGRLIGKVAWRPAPTRRSAAPDAAFDFPLGDSVTVDADRTRAFLKIQDGCERRCAFCVVPSVRGRERSADPDAAEATIRRLMERGVAEVVLAGIHLANFGDGRGTDLAGFLARFEERPPPGRLRLSSVEPMEAGARLVDLVASASVVAPHLHLPAQSGSDAVLRRMRRGLTADRFRRLVARGHARNPRLHFATDVLVGFPGESDAEFEETRRLLEELPLASLHVFPFSPRSGTDAAERHRRDSVDRKAVAERAAALRELSDAKLRAFTAAAAGTVADTLVLRGGRALTDHYLDVALSPDVSVAPGTRFAARLLPQPSGEGLLATRHEPALAAATC